MAQAKRSAMKACANAEELHAWINERLGVNVPRVAVCRHHQAPFEYLRRAYFEPAQDLVVWAPRGGGKTRLGAIATLLDLLHKPGCQVRILGGSLQQSLRMWEHLRPDVTMLARRQILKGGGSGVVKLRSGSCAGVLTQSQRAVRGLRVQKLRCDEVEMFESPIWEAAQLVTKSRKLKGVEVRGAIEAISTMHQRGGLMQQIVDGAAARNVPVIRWCLMEVLERCGDERPCGGCGLWEECRGAAKTACEGFVTIDDALAMKSRVSVETWEAEMLCRRPSVRKCVFPHFRRDVHVVENEPAGAVHLGIDFGFANPFVCLWIVRGSDGRMTVVDEYVQEGRTVEEHVAEIENRGRRPVTVACDPAGSGRNDQTALSNVDVLRRRGYEVRFRSSRIVEGVEMVRTALRPGLGEPKLFVHRRCGKLIAALEGYRYADGGGELPVKDGVHDHLVDALRYYLVNAAGSGNVVSRRY